MPERMVLALDGSTDACTTALLLPSSGLSDDQPWRVVTRRAEADGRAQARVLLHLVDDMLREVGGCPGDLGAIVAGIGPGTFTGVRITVATARALALALAVPTVGVSTLAGLAAEVAWELSATESTAGSSAIVTLVDARRGQVFYSMYREVGEAAARRRNWLRLQEYGVCDREALPAMLDGLSSEIGRIVVAGDARVLPGDGVGAASAPGAVHTWQSRATTVGAEWLVQGQGRLQEPGESPLGARLAAYLLGALEAGVMGTEGGGHTVSRPAPGEIGSPEAVKPIYVRSPDADIHITKMRDPWAAAQ